MTYTDPWTRELRPVCAGCREPLDDADALEIVEVRSGRVFHVHRPSTMRPCFRWKVGPASRHRIVTPESPA